jgi:cytochrome c553
VKQQTSKGNGMFHIKSNIATGLALAAVLMTTGGFAQSDTENPLTTSVQANAGRPQSIKLGGNPGDPAAGREKSQLCQGCHGEYGNSTEPIIPKLAGQYANYIAKELRNYQAGTRSHQIMNAMAATINDDDLADIAAYFASQNKMEGDGSADNPLGKELFLHGDPSIMRLACVNCHGINGKGVNAKISMFPVIGGQHKEYIRRQLVNFKNGSRTNSPNAIMNRIAQSLTDKEIEALAEYVSVQ